MKLALRLSVTAALIVSVSALSAQMTSVRGKISGIQDQGVVSLLVRPTSGSSVVVKTAPMSFLLERKLSLRVGENVTVIGYKRFSGREAYVEANKITTGGISVTVRDETGHALWPPPQTSGLPESDESVFFGTDDLGNSYGRFDDLQYWLFENQMYGYDIGPGVRGWNDGAMFQLQGGPVLMSGYRGSVVVYPRIRWIRR